MKRITYISWANDLSPKQIQQIREVSVKNNSYNGITGVLLCLKGLFFQILEGDGERVDKLYEKILVDERHRDILCLKTELDVTEKMFPDWGMKTINLDEQEGIILEPIKSLLFTIAESHRILEKYTQPSVINIITQGIDPLTVAPHIVEKIIFFSDIVSFSTFSEKLPVDKVVNLVNHYLTICTEIISAHGGEVIKFIGDCVMAGFSTNQADAAISTGLEILAELKSLRELTEVNDPLHFLYTGIGLSCGNVIEGNIGSPVKMDYTLLGDAVNVASRLEALSRHLPYSMILSTEVKNYCCTPWSFINLGRHQMKGKQTLVEIFAINDSIVRKSSDASQIANFIAQALDMIAFKPQIK
ncbi:MAG: family 3 adenylate cyclase [Beggiatoa sp. IS2]|nr:MAG: family 3 adenylate cyclase [Beggiatoa sp. IS2]